MKTGNHLHLIRCINRTKDKWCICSELNWYRRQSLTHSLTNRAYANVVSRNWQQPMLPIIISFCSVTRHSCRVTHSVKPTTARGLTTTRWAKNRDPLDQRIQDDDDTNATVTNSSKNRTRRLDNLRLDTLDLFHEKGCDEHRGAAESPSLELWCFPSVQRCKMKMTTVIQTHCNDLNGKYYLHCMQEKLHQHASYFWYQCLH